MIAYSDVLPFALALNFYNDQINLLDPEPEDGSLQINMERQPIEELQAAINENDENQVYACLKLTSIDNAVLTEENLMWLLQSAVKNSEDRLVSQLLARKPNLQSTEGGQLLWLALDDTRKNSTPNNNTKIASMLISAGANLNVKRSRDSASLIHALASSLNRHRQKLALTLIQGDVDVNDRNSRGETLLHSAIKGGSIDIVNTLISKGAQINNYQNEDEQYPLHVACRYSSVEIITLLLSFGADINALDGNGCTPYATFTESDTCYRSNSEIDGKAAMVKHFALTIAGNGVVTESDLVAAYNLEFIFYDIPHIGQIKVKLYNACVQELEKMKKFKIIDEVSYHLFLTKRIDQLIGLVRRTDLVEKIRTQLWQTFFDNREAFPIYYRDVLIKFRIVRKLKKMIARKEQELREVFTGIFPCVVINLISQNTCLLEFYEVKDHRDYSC